MDIDIEWQRPLRLTKARKLLFTHDQLPEELGSDAGVYYFSRRFGPTYTPFYIGETTDLRRRLAAHLRDIKIVDVLRGDFREDHRIAQGARYFHFGLFVPKQRQDTKKCIRIVERAMIRQAVESRIPILNSKLTKVKVHSVTLGGSAVGRGFFGPTYSVEP